MVTAEVTRKAFDIEVKDPAQGTISAVFSTFNVIDSDGDVVQPGAIPDGAEVPIVIAHDWQQLPVGKGVISVNRKQAVLNGQFFMETQAGREAFLTVKAMGKAQQYSWGFEVTQSDFGEFDGKQVRFIKQTRPFEISPVIVGSNPNTGTISIKDACPACGQTSNPEDKLKGEKQATTQSVQVDWRDRARLDMAKARIGDECS